MIPALLATVVMLGAAQQTTPRDRPLDNAAIRGRVVAADTGAPLRGARVVLTLLPSVDGSDVRLNLQSIVGITRRNGTFQIHSLRPGRYEIQARPGDESAQFVEPLAGRVVDIAVGQTLDNVEIRVARGGVIAGRVTDAGGAPLTGITVYALAMASSFPGRVRQYTAAAPTNDLGQFRVYGLHDGEFLVCAEARVRDYASPAAVPVDPLLPTFHPSTTNEDASVTVRVRSGVETSVEIRMLQGRRARITGILLDAAGAPVPRARGFVTRPANRMGGAAGAALSTDEYGRFDVRDLAPGDYQISAWKFSESRALAPAVQVEFGNVALTIAGTDVENLIVRTAPGAILRGQLEFDRPPADSASLRVSVTIGNPDGTCVERASVTMFADENHAFQVGDLFCAYLVRASVPGYAVERVVLDGADITDTPHRFKTGDRVTVTLTSHTSTVDGTVLDDEDAAATDCEVVAFSQEPARWIGSATMFNRAACDDRGQFRLTQVLPGRYFVIAIRRGRLPGPSGLIGTFFERLSGQATVIAVGEDDGRTVELRLIDPR